MNEKTRFPNLYPPARKLVFPSSKERRAQQEISRPAAAQPDAKRAADAQASADAKRARKAVEAEQRQKDQAQARREKARCDAIMNSPHAQADVMYAIELAHQSDVSSAEAIEMMRTHAAAKRARSWNQAMSRAQNRAWSDDSEPPSSWDAVMRKVSR